MFEDSSNFVNYGSIWVIFISLFLIFGSGLFLGTTYYVMDQVQDNFEGIDCTINDNVFVDSCQELFELSIFPLLRLKSILIWFNFFFIFGLVIGMLILGYQSGKSPALMGLMTIIVIVATYLSIYLSNGYRTLLENDLFRQMMVEFTVYNKIMLSFPWFIFIVSLFSAILSLVNWQKSRINTPKEELDY